MKRIILATIAIGASLNFSGCAVQDAGQSFFNTLDKPFVALNKIIPDPDDVFNSKNISKNTDNLKPWKIKASDDSHYVLDPFFALPNAHNLEEAKGQIGNLLDAIRDNFVLSGQVENSRLRPLRGRCKLVFSSGTKGTGVNMAFKIKEADYCGKGGTIRYIQFKPLKINGIYYMVVKDTNAKDSNLLSIFKDSVLELRANNYNVPGFTQPVYNDGLCKWINQLAKFMIKQKNWSNNFIDVQTDSKDPKANIYRFNFTKYFKKG